MIESSNAITQEIQLIISNLPHDSYCEISNDFENTATKIFEHPIDPFARAALAA